MSKKNFNKVYSFSKFNEVAQMEKMYNNKQLKFFSRLNALTFLFNLFSTLLLKTIRGFINVTFSFFALIIFFPLFLIISLLILVSTGRPIFYKQLRVGRAGKQFYMWKFRTMKKEADIIKKKLQQFNEAGKVIFKIKNDPRITTLGKLLRKTSLDELPQLWNVLRGDMALVGPRPHLLQEVNKYSLDERKRLLAKPGITGLWQVSGRSNVSFTKQVQLDEKYILNQGIKQDVKILFKTISAVFKGNGAY